MKSDLNSKKKAASSLIKTRFVFKNRKFLYPHEAELIRIEVDPQ